MINHNYFILPVIKPKNISSFKTLYSVKKKCNFDKNLSMGHTGTLDPFATGILILVGGKATKLVKYFNMFPKTYFAKVVFGKKTETGDSDGKIVETGRIPDKDEVLDILNYFKGDIFQAPHKYSAVKINGKRAYEYSRNNIKINLKPKKIKIYKLNMIFYNKRNGYGIFKITCSSGTYIRSLFEDIAKKLNSFSYTDELVRLSIGNFTISQALKISTKIKNNLTNPNSDLSNTFCHNIKKFLIMPSFNIFNNLFPVFKIHDDFKLIFKNGKKISITNLENIIKTCNNNMTINKISKIKNFTDNFKYIGFYNDKGLICTILEIKNNNILYSFNYPEII